MCDMSFSTLDVKQLLGFIFYNLYAEDKDHLQQYETHITENEAGINSYKYGIFSLQTSILFRCDELDHFILLVTLTFILLWISFA